MTTLEMIAVSNKCSKKGGELFPALLAAKARLAKTAVRAGPAGGAFTTP